jgi:hypothetical protein
MCSGSDSLGNRPGSGGVFHYGYRRKAAAMPALAVITVGVLSQKSGVSIETIRSYEQMNLIPKPTTAPDGLQLYRSDDIGRLPSSGGLRAMDSHSAPSAN